MIKSIFSQGDLNSDPGNIFNIKGKGNTTPITTKHQLSPTIILGADSTSIQMPNQEKTYLSKNITEIPMNSYQAGGAASQDQQIQQVIMAYAQLSGQKPEEVMKQLQSLPPDQQQQALSSMVKTVQQAMSQQQNAEQQEAQAGQQDQENMMDQQEEMGMAEMGGCIDCQEQFPQAQNLEWYYKKAKGGEAFPQANVYPHMYQNAGTVYTDYDRASDSSSYANYYIPYNIHRIVKGETFGSHEDIGSAEDFGGDYSAKEIQDFYRDPRKVGFAGARKAAVDAFRKQGKAGKLYLTNDEIRDAAIKFKNIDNTGKATLNSNIYGTTEYDLKNSLSEPDYWRLMQEIKRNAGKKAEGGEAFPQAQTYLPYDRPGETRPNFMFQTGGPKMKKADYEKAKKQYFDALHNYGQNNLSTEQYNQMQSDHANIIDDMRFYEPEGYWTPLPLKDAAYQIGNTGRNILNQVAGTHYQEGGEPNQYGGEADLDAIYRLMKKGGIDYDPKKKKGGKIDHLEQFKQYLAKGGSHLSKAQAGRENNLTSIPQMQSRSFQALAEPNYLNDEPRMVDETGFIPGTSYPDTQQGYKDYDRFLHNPVNSNVAKSGPQSNRNRSQYFNPAATYEGSKFLGQMLGRTGSALFSLGSLAGFNPLNDLGTQPVNNLFGTSRGKFKHMSIGPDGVSREKYKGPDAGAVAKSYFNQEQPQPNKPSEGKYPNIFPYKMEPGENWQYGGGPTYDSFKYKYRDVNAGMKAGINNLSGAQGYLDAIPGFNAKDAYNNQTTNTAVNNFGSGYGATKSTMSSFGTEAPASAMNNRSAVNPYASAFPANQSPNSAIPQYLQSQSHGGSVWDKYEDGGEYDINDLTQEDIDAIIAAGGSIEYI